MLFLFSIHLKPEIMKIFFTLMFTCLGLVATMAQLLTKRTASGKELEIHPRRPERSHDARLPGCCLAIRDHPPRLGDIRAF